MNAHVFAFASAPEKKTTGPGFEPEAATLPDPEWGLSAPQVVAVVVVILLASEVVGMMF